MESGQAPPTDNERIARSYSPRQREALLTGIAVAAACVVTLAIMGSATIFLAVVLVLAYALWLPRRRWAQGEHLMVFYSIAVLVQIAHLVEEFLTGFYREFPPVFGAEAWSARRYLIFNFAWLLVFALAGIGLARGKRPAFLVAIFLAIGGGITNGIGHLALSVREGGYFPGAYTGVIALIVGSLLAYRLLRPPPLPNA
jgi:hypothetical protein